MIILPFRLHHLFKLLAGFEEQAGPLDISIHHYFSKNKAIGSKDRAFIAETAYTIIRWKGLLSFLSNSTDWQKLYETLIATDLKAVMTDETIPMHIRVSFPKILFDLLVDSHGLDKAVELCQICNTQAPTTIRVNTLKTTREKLVERWSSSYDISPTNYSKTGITFNKRIPFFELPEFKEGLFEVQDEGSQLLSELLKPTSKSSVLDYCAGSGGKTLAFAPSMQGGGQIYLHDIRPYALQEAKKRLKRAGIQNAQLLFPDSPHCEKLKKKMDWVLVDAPCTGTGTLRRNPDMKWRFDEETLPKLVGQQRHIFEKALSYLKPGGYIVYATCSVLKEENQDQLNHFLKTYPLSIVGEPLQTIPSINGMDGFFGVVLKKN